MRLFGHDFQPMTADDFLAFEGAEDGSLIWVSNDAEDPILIYTPSKISPQHPGTLRVIEVHEGTETQYEAV